MSNTTNHIEGYLKKFSDDEKQLIKSVYETEAPKAIKEALAQITRMSTAGKLKPMKKRMVIPPAAPGTGTSTYMKNYVDQQIADGHFIVLLDADNYRNPFPTGHNLVKDLHAEFGAFNLSDLEMPEESQDEYAKILEDTANANNKWRKAQMYIRDKLACDFRQLGIPIALVSTLHSPDAGVFLYEARKDGYEIELHISDTTSETKLAANRHREQRGSYVSEDVIKQKDGDVGRNMPDYANYADKIVVLWRDGQHDNLKAVAVSDGSHTGSKILNTSTAAKFNGNRGAGTVETILEDHKLATRGRALMIRLAAEEARRKDKTRRSPQAA